MVLVLEVATLAGLYLLAILFSVAAHLHNFIILRLKSLSYGRKLSVVDTYLVESAVFVGCFRWNTYSPCSILSV